MSNDIIFGRGGADTIYGLGGNDRINAGAGDDQVFGGPGNDVLLGRGGNDGLFGGAGNDHLNGAGGQNRLTGGAGADHFVFSRHDSVATITDFTQGVDKLDLLKTIFKSLDHVSYQAATGALLFDPDGAGGAKPVEFGVLAPHLHITAADFLLV